MEYGFQPNGSQQECEDEDDRLHDQGHYREHHHGHHQPNRSADQDQHRPGREGSRQQQQQEQQRSEGDGKQTDAVAHEGDLFLKGCGWVSAVLFNDSLVWHKLPDGATTTKCCGCSTDESCLMRTAGGGSGISRNSVHVCDIYAVEALGVCEFKTGGLFSQAVEMHCFAVHTFERRPTKWVPQRIVFAHAREDEARDWVASIEKLLRSNPERPRRLLVFVNPYGGSRRGLAVWEECRQVFEKAGVVLEVVATTRRGHAYDMLDGASDDELLRLDGVVVVGGDGFFNEVLNGIVKRRHLAPPCKRPNAPSRSANSSQNGPGASSPWGAEPGHSSSGSPPSSLAASSSPSVLAPSSMSVTARGADSACPLDSLGMGPEGQSRNKGDSCSARTEDGLEGRGKGGAAVRGEAPVRSASQYESWNVGLTLGKKLRIGIIPAGSTDCIQMSVTGSRDHITAALHIVIGERMPLDIVRVTSWRDDDGGDCSGGPSEPQSAMGEDRPFDIRYAASFAGYGFYGDVARESEELRWMGPARYDYAGFMTYMRHRTYEADISYLDMQQHAGTPTGEGALDSAAEAVAGAAAARLRVGDAAPAAEDDCSSGRQAVHGNQWESPIGGSPSRRSRRWTGSSAEKKRRGSKASAVARAAVCTMGCLVCASGRDFSLLARTSMDFDAASTPPATPPHPITADAAAHEAAPGRGHSGNGRGEDDADDDEGRAMSRTTTASSSKSASTASMAAGPCWRSVRGRFHSVGAAVMSCRNEKAPDGVAAHAHLADGNLDLILIRCTSRPQYLLQLLRLTWKGADPLDFSFVEHHKTPAFTFCARGERSRWNIDGEVLDAQELSAQVYRGLIDLFASGPES